MMNKFNFHRLQCAAAVAGVVMGAVFLKTPAHAGAWAQPEGRGLSLLTYRFYQTDEGFDGHGNRQDFANDGEFTKHEANLYVEYGLPYRVTLLGNFFLQHLSFRDDVNGRDAQFGLADQELGVRWQFLEREGLPRMAVQTLVKIPGPYRLGDTPPLGNDQVDWESVLYVGDNHRLLGCAGFWEVGIGPRFRFDEPSDQLRWFATLGWRVTEKIEWIGQLEGTHGLGNERPQRIGNNITATTDFTLLKASMSGIYHVNEQWAVSAGPMIHFYGENTGAGGGAQASLWFRF